MANLTVIQGQDRGKVYDLQGKHIVLGRDPHCEVSLTDHSVSRHHAELRVEQGKFHLVDLNSSNGTFVNGVKARESIVRPGDQIRVGAVVMTLGRVVTGPEVFGAGPIKIDEAGNIVDAAIMATARSDFDPAAAIQETAEDAQVRRMAENLRTLLKFSAALGGIIDTQQLLDTIMDMVFEVVDADRAFVLLLDPVSKRLEPRAVRYRDELIRGLQSERAGEKPAEPAARSAIHVSRTIVNYCLDKSEGVLSTNAMQDRRFEEGDSVQDLGIRSAICVPIKSRERITGVIHVDTQLQQAPFTENDLRMMTAVGYLAGLALENARLVESTVHRERLAAVGETVASISHYVKNILQGLQGGASVIEGGLRDKKFENIGRGWEIVSRNQRRINDLVLDMLHYTRKSEPNLQRQNVNAVLREAIELVMPVATEKHVAIVSKLDPELPEIWIDGAGLHHACLNILVNAVQAVEPRTGQVTVSTAVEDAPHNGHGRGDVEQNFVIAVADNGPGIPEQQLNRIFLAFHSTKGGQGTGLGLAVSQKIVAEHHGRIDVDSLVGAGSTFTIRLPIIKPKSAEDTGVTVLENHTP